MQGTDAGGQAALAPPNRRIQSGAKSGLSRGSARDISIVSARLNYDHRRPTPLTSGQASERARRLPWAALARSLATRAPPTSLTRTLAAPSISASAVSPWRKSNYSNRSAERRHLLALRSLARPSKWSRSQGERVGAGTTLTIDFQSSLHLPAARARGSPLRLLAFGGAAGAIYAQPPGSCQPANARRRVINQVEAPTSRLQSRRASEQVARN